jgi:MSHA biogenesis protein MshQ
MNFLRLVPFAVAALLACASAQAQIAFRAAATAAAATGTFATVAHASVGAAAAATGCAPTSINPGLPGGTVAGDFLVAVVTSRDNEGISMAAGWNVLYSDVASTAYQARVFWKIAQGGDATTITKAAGGGCNVMIGRVSRFTGVDNANPFDGAVGASSQTAGTVTTGSTTTTVATSMLVITAHTADNSNTGSPAGFTEAWDSSTTAGNDASIALKWRLEAAAGAKGPFNMTKSLGSDANHGVLFALRPAPSGLTINVPAGTVAGDIMIASIAVRTSAVLITPPAGWSAQAATVQNAGASSRQQIFTRVATAGEPANYTWTFDLAHSGAVGAILSYSGVDTAAPIDAFAGNTTPQGGDTNLQHRALSVTTTVADAMVISTHVVSSAVSWTAAGVTERVDIASQAVPNAVGISLGVYEAVQAVAGATGDRIATANANGDTGGAHFIALRPFVPQPVLHWTLDQPFWDGTPGEAVDLSGNGLHGTAFLGANTAFLTPAIAGSPGTCRYGAFDGADDYVEVADNPLLDITDELTVMMWLRPTAYPTGGNLKSFVSKDGNYEAHLDSAGRVYWWWGGGVLELRTTGTVPLNNWTHVAIVYSRAGAYQRIYFNGVQDPTTNNQTGALVANNMPFQIASDQGFAGRQFPGLIDEVYVFASALSQTRVQQYMNTTRACASAIDHFAISHAGSGVGCVDQAITITAHDATHTAVDANALLVNLSTSHGKGTWTGIQAGGGTLNDPVAGDGTGTYTFAFGSNSVTLLFRNANITGTSETFNFNVTGGGFSETTGNASGTDDQAFTMYEAGFRFRNIEDATETVPVQISGKASNTGFNARTVRLQAINTNSATGSCTNLFASQSQTVELGAECNNPAACAARQVSVNGSNIATSNDNAGAGAAAYTGLSLAFDANSEAAVVLAYPDAGQVSLHAQFDLNPLVAGLEMAGSSNVYVVRPFGLAFPGVAHSSTAAGTVLAAAGDNFSMTVQGYQWAAGEDATDDGVPDAGSDITDNGTVPNFAATASVSPSANLPGVQLGIMRRGAGCVAAASVAMSGGAGTANDWCYSEAGNVVLNADVADYLAAGVNIAGNSGLDGDANGGYVGRFKPKHFAVTGAPTLANRASLACAPVSTFTYMGEQLSLGFTLEAQNTQNAITQNYTGAYAKLNLATAANLGIGARSGATDLTARVDSSLVPSGGFVNGSAALAVGTGIGRPTTPINPDGPYASTQFGIAPNDNDPDAAGGVKMGTFDLDVDSAGGADHFAVGPTAELRFGRLNIFNAYGPVSVVLPIRLETQYWSTTGNAFVRNQQDSCTSLNREHIRLSGYTLFLGACETAVSEASVNFSSGLATLTLAASGVDTAPDPDVPNAGTVLLTPILGPVPGGSLYCPSKGGVEAGVTTANRTYLQGKWTGATWNENPAARAAFGLYGSQPKNFIFFRENF